MPGHEFFERQQARFALQADAAKRNVDRQARTEVLISRAEYECQQMRRDLSAAFAVPLSHRAVVLEPVPVVEAAEPVVAAAPPPARAVKAA
ncbi:MAG TPA: hypothetical protein VLW88_01010 [Hyphomicrobium sp.]|nr:hypothetical protein [Hyphomicrobium sp.]